jgi:RNA ligase (TIGR02306 family)
MQERAMATVRKIDSISPIKDADKIELAHIGGWQVVVRKGQFEQGQSVVYCEVDAFVPHTIAPFLTKDGHYPKVFNEIEGQRLKTVKLRGELSQGLLLDMNDVLVIEHECNFGMGDWKEGDDVSEFLGIVKWEKPLAACLAGVARGNFPTAVPKTDQDRVQNMKKYLNDYVSKNLTFEVTEKLHGSSGTFYLDMDGVFHVCSRNLDLNETESNSFWKIARQYDIENKMKELDLYNVAIQGEVIGEGINGGQYGVTLDFYVFDVYDVELAKYSSSKSRVTTCSLLGLKHVPIIDFFQFGTSFIGYSADDMMNDLLIVADGESKLNKSKREGLVFKCLEDPSVSFKVVSNKWLLAGGEDQ